MHTRTHDAAQSELRGDILTLRDLKVFSPTLGFSGACDVVDFHKTPDGIPLRGREGLWQPFPVEYKRGKPKPHRADELQLCAQALCLEEMLCCDIPEGALFYGETRRRQPVALDDELRALTQKMAHDMHTYARRGHTPRVKPGKGCNACSLSDLCLPVLCKSRSAAGWTNRRISGEDDV